VSQPGAIVAAGNWPFVRRPGQRLDWARACSGLSRVTVGPRENGVYKGARIPLEIRTPLALLMDGVKVGDVPRREPRNRPQTPARWAVPVGGSGPSQWNEPLKWSDFRLSRLVPRSRPLHHRAGEHEGKRFRPKTVELSAGSTGRKRQGVLPVSVASPSAGPAQRQLTTSSPSRGHPARRRPREAVAFRTGRGVDELRPGMSGKVQAIGATIGATVPPPSG
jgi:hypothetical protein